MLVQLLTIAAIAYVGLAAYLYLFQESYVFFPSRAVHATPAAVGLDYDDVRVETDDGVIIHGWFLPAAGARFTVLFLHGNAGNISHRLDSLRLFHRLGLNILIMDYRGYGRSQGRPSEQGTYQDAEAAWRYLVRTRGIPPEQILVFGRSLGGGVATWLALEHPVGGLIIESTPTSVPDMGTEVYPFLPVRLLARLHYNTLRRIPDVNVPVLVIHSSDDEIVPARHGRRIFAAAREPKAFLAIRGDHNGGFLMSGEDYVKGLRDFIEGLPPPSPRLPAGSGGPVEPGTEQGEGHGPQGR